MIGGWAGDESGSSGQTTFLIPDLEFLGKNFFISMALRKSRKKSDKTWIQIETLLFTLCLECNLTFLRFSILTYKMRRVVKFKLSKYANS